MGRKDLVTAGIVSVLTVAMAAPAIAGGLRPATSPVASTTLPTLVKGRAGATTGRKQQALVGDGTAVAVAVLAAGAAGFGIYRATKNDNPSSR